MNPDIEAAAKAVEYLHHAFATNSRDWGAQPDDAWLFGVVCGWGPEHDGPLHDDATAELARQHGWGPEQVELLGRLHMGFRLLPDLLRELVTARAEAQAHRYEVGHADMERDTVRELLRQARLYGNLPASLRTQVERFVEPGAALKVWPDGCVGPHTCRDECAMAPLSVPPGPGPATPVYAHDPHCNTGHTAGPQACPPARTGPNRAKTDDEVWAGYKDQSYLSRVERGEHVRCHVARPDGAAWCTGDILDDSWQRGLAEVPEHMRCKKRGCKQRWPS